MIHGERKGVKICQRFGPIGLLLTTYIDVKYKIIKKLDANVDRKDVAKDFKINSRKMIQEIWIRTK